MTPDAQFQLRSAYPGNWDRCRRCGLPRLLHGADGGCGIGTSLSYRALVLLVAAGVLTVIGVGAWLLVIAPAIPAASVLAFAGLIVVALFVGGLALPARRG